MAKANQISIGMLRTAANPLAKAEFIGRNSSVIVPFLLAAFSPVADRTNRLGISKLPIIPRSNSVMRFKKGLRIEKSFAHSGELTIHKIRS
jgi:hypothetical protein